MNKKEMNNKGFSLVELIIVIAIMAVLVGVLAPQFIKYVESARQSTDIDNVNSLKSAVEAYVADNLIGSGSYTITIGSSGATVAGDTGVVTECNNLGLTDAAGVLSFRSSGWTAGVATYSTSTYKWSETTTFVANGNSPGKDLKTVFGF